MSRYTTWSRLIMGVVLGSLGIVLLAGTVSAQSTNADCGLAPLTLPLFEATPVAVIAVIPSQEEASPAVDDVAVEAAMRQIVACANDTDPAVAYAIFTSRYLASQFLDPTATYLPAFEYLLAEGNGAAEGTLELEEVASHEVLPDGRLQVVAVVSTGAATFTDTFILAHVDGEWLIDEVTNLDPAP